MKLMKLSTFFIVITFLTTWSFDLSAQTTIENVATAYITTENQKNNVVYSFDLLADYNEFSSNQHVGRMKTITGSNIILNLKKNRLYVTIDPKHVKEDDLDNLLRGLIVLNGYSGYKISQ